MALLDWIAPESGLRVEGEGVFLRPPRAQDFAEWRELRAQSRAFLQPWEPTWSADDLSRAAFRRRLMAYARDRDAGIAYPFFVFRVGDEALTGGITLSNIRRGVAQMGSVGYWCGRPFARQGLTLAAVRADVRGGMRLADALAARPRDFPSIYRALIAAGEES
eukprot:gene21874-42042_t